MRTTWITVTLVVVGLIALGASTFSGADPIETGNATSSYIDIEKYVAVDGGAWQDADYAPGPEVPESSYVEFMFVVTNCTSDNFLTCIVLADNMYEFSGCPVPPILFPGQSFECVIGPFDCVRGQHTNIATVSCRAADGDTHIDTDHANYFGLGGDNEQPGTGTPGYWKNHAEAWPVEEITVGGMIYTRDEAIGLMGTPGRRDKTFTMFRSLVAAMLNVMIGNDSSCIEDVILQADNWMALYPVGSGVLAKSDAWQDNEWLHLTLAEYNNGLLCAPPRD